MAWLAWQELAPEQPGLLLMPPSMPYVDDSVSREERMNPLGGRLKVLDRGALMNEIVPVLSE